MIENISAAWRVGSHITGIDPAVALAELARIEHEGRVTAESVKEAARPEGAPLHPAVFDLPPNEAAEAYYSRKAGDVIRAIVMTDPAAPGEFERVYVHVPSPEGGAFERARVLVTQPDRWRLAYAEVVRDVVEARDALRRLDRIASESQTPPKEMPRVHRASKAMDRAVSALIQTQP